MDVILKGTKNVTKRGFIFEHDPSLSTALRHSFHDPLLNTRDFFLHTLRPSSHKIELKLKKN